MCLLPCLPTLVAYLWVIYYLVHLSTEACGVLSLLKLSETLCLPKSKQRALLNLLHQEAYAEFLKLWKKNLAIETLPFFLQKCMMYKALDVVVLGEKFYIPFLLSLPF